MNTIEIDRTSHSYLLGKTEAILERYKRALEEIIDLDQHNHGPESKATKIARFALSQ